MHYVAMTIGKSIGWSTGDQAHKHQYPQPEPRGRRRVTDAGQPGSRLALTRHSW
jgi:hypothetical protein